MIKFVCSLANEAWCDDITRNVAYYLPSELDLSRGTILPNEAASVQYVIIKSGRSFDIDLHGSTFVRTALSLFLPSVTSFEINQNSPGRQHLNTPATVFASSSKRFENTVRTLNLHSCNVTARQLRELATKFKNLKTPIKTLNISRNEVGDEGASYLAELIGSGKTESLWIVQCNITHVGVREITKQIAQRPNAITALNLSDNHIGDEGASELADVIGKIEDLRIEGCNITHIDERELTRKIAELRHAIKYIDLPWNVIGDEGALELANVLRKIETLTIARCRINGVGVMKLREKINQLRCTNPKLNYTLQHLDHQTGTVKYTNPHR